VEQPKKSESSADSLIGADHQSVLLFALGVSTLLAVQVFHLGLRQIDFAQALTIGLVLAIYHTLQWQAVYQSLGFERVVSSVVLMSMAFVCAGLAAMHGWKTPLFILPLPLLTLALPWSIAKSEFLDKGPAFRDQYFVHDLINHLVGLKLFLSTRAELRGPEMGLVLREVDTMETLIVDHYGVVHKNALRKRQYQTPAEFEARLELILKNFITARGIESSFVFSPELRSSALEFPVAPLFRIFSNLVKNAFDHGSPQVEVQFMLFEGGMKLVVKSKLKGNLRRSLHLEEDLSQIILEEELSDQGPTSARQGLGLESVASLCEKHGGDFHFHLTPEMWVNEVFLPAHASDQNASKSFQKAA
jgi:signal transduction histidine kinase